LAGESVCTRVTVLLVIAVLLLSNAAFAFAQMPDANSADDSNTVFEETGPDIRETGLIPVETTLPDSNQAADSSTQTDNEQSQEDQNQASNSELPESQGNTQPAGMEEPPITPGFPTAVAMGSTHCPKQPKEPDENTLVIEAYPLNEMLCSNRPTGQYCTDWEASCNQTTWAYPNTYFYIYMRVYDIFHNDRYDYSIRIDADDPNGEDIRWWNGSEWVDHLEYRYNGTGTWAYLCNQFWIYLTTHTGQWRLKFRLHDYLDGTNYYFSKYITIKCDNDSHCSAGQACRSNHCVTCTSHSYYKCYNDDLYWYDSCDRREEMKEDCRISCGWDTRDGISDYYCSNGMKANWNVYVFDLWRNGKPNATVQYDLRDGQGWQFGGQTNSSGNLQFTKILDISSGSGKALDTRAISTEGALCEERYNFFEKEDDTDTYFFLCPEANPDNQLHISMNANRTEYQQEEQIQFSFNVKDNAANNVQGAFIGLILQDGSTATAPNTDSSGNSTYSMTAAGEGVQKFMAITFKEGYKNASTETSITVKEKPKTVVEVMGTDQLPVPGATVYVNGQASATTGPTGRATIATPPGTNTIEVESEGQRCGSRSVVGTGSQNIVCEQKGDLVVRLLSPDGSPIANAYIQIDGKQTATTNASGAHYYKGINYGTHNISIFVSIKEAPELDYEDFTASTQTTVNSSYLLKEFILTTSGIQPTATAAENEEVLTLENFEIETATITRQEFTEKGAVIKGKINTDASTFNRQQAATPTMNDPCIEGYQRTGSWPTECQENQIWVATDALIDNINTTPTAMDCMDAKCMMNTAVILSPKIFGPFSRPFWFDGSQFVRTTYTEPGLGPLNKPPHIPSWCLEKFGLARGNIINHINNKIYFGGVEKYNGHIAKYQKGGKECTLFYEPHTGRCEADEGCEKEPKDYIRRPGAGYPMWVPDEIIEETINKNQVQNGWPTITNYDPYKSLTIAPVEGAILGLSAAVIIYGIWLVGKCTIAAFFTGPGAALVCAMP